MLRGSILFVDDEAFLVDVAKTVLEGFGYKVSGQTCCHDALEVFEENPHRFDLVVTDYNMPAMTGCQFAKKLHSIRQDIPVILATGCRDLSNTSVKREGIDEIIFKPYLFKKMDYLIEQLLGCYDQG